MGSVKVNKFDDQFVCNSQPDCTPSHTLTLDEILESSKLQGAGKSVIIQIRLLSIHSFGY